MRSLILLLLALIRIGAAENLEFSKPEWTDPKRTGSTVWLKNGKPRAISIKAMYVRNDGIRTGDELALKLGRQKNYFKVEAGAPGEWRRLLPDGGRAIRMRARDSLLVHGFEYGSGLKARQKRRLAETFVVDLKVIDYKGDSCVVRVTETEPNYFIGPRSGRNEPFSREDGAGARDGDASSREPVSRGLREHGKRGPRSR